MESVLAGWDPRLEMYLEPHWYAIYTCANHEKRVADQLLRRGVEHFLPYYESLRRWKDRKVRLQLPLFPGYVFVRLALQSRLQVLPIPGVVRLVGFDGRPTPVSDDEVTKVREFLTQGHRVEPHSYLQVGRRVRVARGVLEGMEGTVVGHKNRRRFVISFDLIQRSVAVEVSGLELVPVAPNRTDKSLLALSSPW